MCTVRTQCIMDHKYFVLMLASKEFRPSLQLPLFVAARLADVGKAPSYEKCAPASSTAALCIAATLAWNISELMTDGDSSTDHPSDADPFASPCFLRYKSTLLSLLRTSEPLHRRAIETYYQDDLQVATWIPDKPLEQWHPLSLPQFGIGRAFEVQE